MSFVARTKGLGQCEGLNCQHSVDGRSTSTPSLLVLRSD